MLARFDDRSPALVEKQLGSGTVWVLTSGWQPQQSQLALSSKFIPLLLVMFGFDAKRESGAIYHVGDLLPPVVDVKPEVAETPKDEFKARERNPGEESPASEATPLSSADSTSVANQPQDDSKLATKTIVIDPSGERHIVSQGKSFAETSEPGIYAFRRGGESWKVAVNIPPDESRTKPLTEDRLEQFGVQLGEQQPVEVLQEQQRQMRNKELESRQKLWRWGVFAALMLVATETWLGGRQRQPEASTSEAPIRESSSWRDEQR